MKEIPLTKGKFAFVDDCDFEELNKYRWSAWTSRNRKNFYARRRGPGKGRWNIWMHREILKTPIGMVTDHRDGNGLNNQRYNLRVCTQSQNCQNNKSQKNSTSGHRGVYVLPSGNFRVCVSINKKLVHIGVYKTLEEAANTHDQTSLKYHGEFSYINRKIK